MEYGIVYLLTNPVMPGLVKIGMTAQEDIDKRMKELYTTGVPVPFECQFACRVKKSDCAKIEKALHTAFAPQRVNANREFFRIQPEQARAILELFHHEDVTGEVTDEIENDLTPDDKAATQNAEERRLFYVAITRAKKHAYVLYKETCPSPFVTDMVKALNPNSQSNDQMTCPWCRNGNLRSISEGTNRNGTRWCVYRCTNNTAGCQYSWMVRFTNEENIVRQFNMLKRKSRLYVSADDLDRLRQENPNADCGILPGSGRMPVAAPFTPSPPEMPPITPQIQPPNPLDDLPF